MELEQYFKYNMGTDALNNMEDFLDNNNIQDAIDLVGREMAYKANVGYLVSRIEHNEREKAFFEQWLRENEPRPWINNGNGILQDLFTENINFFQTKTIEHINERDRYIVATVIQWLGSNVGMGFLHAALRRAGARIVFENHEEEKPEPEEGFVWITAISEEQKYIPVRQRQVSIDEWNHTHPNEIVQYWKTWLGCKLYCSEINIKPNA